MLLRSRRLPGYPEESSSEEETSEEEEEEIVKPTPVRKIKSTKKNVNVTKISPKVNRKSPKVTKTNTRMLNHSPKSVRIRHPPVDESSILERRIITTTTSEILGGHQTTNVRNEFHSKEYSSVYESCNSSSPMTYFDYVRHFVHTILGPLILMTLTPNLVMFLWYTVAKAGGSFQEALSRLSNNATYCDSFSRLWGNTPIASQFSVGVIGCYCLWTISLMRLLPGRRVEGPVTPRGNLPVYKDNGFFCYSLTMIALCVMTPLLKRNYNVTPSIVFDRFDEIVISLCLFAYLFCLGLYFKGIWFPSSSDNSTTGNPIFDYYWGTELYPRILGLDVKVFTNCRFGMTVWGLLVAIFGLKSYETFGFRQDALVTTVLQLLYITKFFWWESGYYRTTDIMTDRGGFYMCWGCIVFMPGMCASPSLYIAKSGVDLGWVYSIGLLALGVASFFVNYEADKQKQIARRTNGDCLIWGKPAQVIRARYLLETGEYQENVLLISGYWGLACHFHYVPELLLALSWSASTGFTHLFPFSYFIFLLILLVHRALRDDRKCLEKYGIYWQQYRRLVPYRILPYVF